MGWTYRSMYSSSRTLYPPGKSPRLSLNRRLSGSQKRSGRRGLELRSLGRLTRSQSLYRLSCPGSLLNTYKPLATSNTLTNLNSLQINTAHTKSAQFMSLLGIARLQTTLRQVSVGFRNFNKSQFQIEPRLNLLSQ
jgi:hypothetical protein